MGFLFNLHPELLSLQIEDAVGVDNTLESHSASLHRGI